MKALLFLVVVVTVCMANVITRQDEAVYRPGTTYPRFIAFPDEKGELYTFDLEAAPKSEAFEDARNAADNRYWLYTRQNPNTYQTLIINDAKSVYDSYFDFTKNVVVIVHGWQANGKTDPNPLVRKALLANNDANVITLDWRRLAALDYVTAAYGVPGVGRGLGQFMLFLNSLGVQWTNMHLIGFSLGGHLVGIAGRECSGRIARITGLDPAGPQWNYNINKISATDAVYVEAIHTSTSSGALGIASPVARADFFPNANGNMPGCLNIFSNHLKAYEYYASTITNRNLFGRRCDNRFQFARNNCSGTYFEMGNDLLNKWGNGIYRLNTARNYPY